MTRDVYVVLTGCNIVPMCHGIWKDKMLKGLWEGKYSLSHLGNTTADFEDVLLQCTAFV